VGARFAVEGRISIGHLVAFYGYAVFLIEPMRTLGEAADKITKAHVAAARVVRILSLEPEFPDQGTRVPPAPAGLTDPGSGLVVRPGRLTAIAAADPVDAQAIADRLGRYAEAGEARYGGVPLAEVAGIRRRILVSVNDDRLFSGRLRDELTGDRRPAGDHDPADVSPESGTPDEPDGSGETGWTGDDGWAGQDGDLDLDAALYAACAQDIVDEVGLDSHVEEAGREFSGGQRQRLRLARVLAADPDVLVLVEPTSAVDAHTEARIAGRLAKARGGRTTVVCTTSPLVLDRADHVAYVEDGRVVAEGTHADLLRTAPAYAATVTREESAE
jgi:ABC-type multidrug transport system fused ATPase/permease subunit